MVLLGLLIGGILGMIILCWLVSFVAFKSLEPHKRATATVLTAWVIATALYGYNSGSYLLAGTIYAISGVAAFFERLRHYNKHWVSDTHIQDTFS
ncbi:MAG: hypothetical protein J0H88_17275 [Sphingomonadales bacterium]|nr:hypothetical protein [Sphingomonadales bacterium]